VANKGGSRENCGDSNSDVSSGMFPVPPRESRHSTVEQQGKKGGEGREYS